MKLWERYFTPHTLADAVELLRDFNGKARVIGGGTDLLLDIKQGHAPVAEALVDITHIPEMTRIIIENGTAAIGAGVTHSAIVRDPLLAAHATCLVESCGVVGGPQVRNVATLGGNVAHALPAADGTTSLTVLDAEAEVYYQGERRWMPLADLFLGPGQSLIDPSRDILLGFRFKLCGTREATAFKRIMRPQGVALPILGCALWVRLEDDLNTIQDVRISINPMAPTPIRVVSVEQALAGGSVSTTLIDRAVEIARHDLHPRASKYRATSKYRLEMIEVLLRRALTLAIERARTGKAEPEGVGLQ